MPPRQIERGEIPTRFGVMELQALTWAVDHGVPFGKETFAQGYQTVYKMLKTAGTRAARDRRYRWRLNGALGEVAEDQVTDQASFDAFSRMLKAAGVTHDEVARNVPGGADCHDLLTKSRLHREKSANGSTGLATARAELAPFGQTLAGEDKQLVLKRLAQHQLFKMQLFQAAAPDLTEHLVDPQAWITINSPKLGSQIADVCHGLTGKPQGQLMKLLRERFGLKLNELTREHAQFSADEIIDEAVALLGRIPAKATPPELRALVDSAVHTQGTTIRYVQRVLSDLKLGRKTGDCTDPLSGSGVNAERATAWLYNHLYQMLTFGRGKDLLGRLNLAPGTIEGKPALFVDATEVVPPDRRGRVRSSQGGDTRTAVGHLREREITPGAEAPRCRSAAEGQQTCR